MNTYKAAAWALAIALAALTMTYGYAAAFYRPRYRVYYTFVLSGKAPTTATAATPVPGSRVAVAGTITLGREVRDYVSLLGMEGLAEWTRTVQLGSLDYALALAPTPGGVYLALHSMRGNTSIVAVSLIDEDGEEHWTLSFNASPPVALAPAPDSGVYLVAHTRRGGLTLPLVARVSVDGRLAWAHTYTLSSYQGSPVQLANLSSVTLYGAAQGPHGSLLVTGAVRDPLHDVAIGVAAQIGGDGEPAWAVALVSPDPPTPQGVAYASGTVYIAGLSDYYTGKDRYAWITALSGGRQLWTLTLNGSGADVLRRLTVANDTLYAAGYTSSPPAKAEDALLVKVKAGKPLWQLCIGGGGNDFATDVTLINGTVTLTGVAQLLKEYGGLLAFIPPSGLRGSTEAYRPCRLAPTGRPLRAVKAGIKPLPAPKPFTVEPDVYDIYLASTVLVRHPVRVYGYRPGWESVALGVLPAAIIVDAALLALVLIAGRKTSRRPRRHGKKRRRA